MGLAISMRGKSLTCRECPLPSIQAVLDRSIKWVRRRQVKDLPRIGRRSLYSKLLACSTSFLN